MGAFSDNFYSWLDRKYAAEKAAMDAAFKHPDGSECKAQKPENCPYYRDGIKDSEELDDLGENTESTQLEGLRKMWEAANAGQVGGLAGSSFADLEESMNKLNSDIEEYDKMHGNDPIKVKDVRGRLKKVHNYYPNVEYGTYDLDNYANGPKQYSDGYSATFHTTSSKGISGDEYDYESQRMAFLTGSKIDAGVYQGGEEASFNEKNILRAMAIAVRFQQAAIYSWAENLMINNLDVDLNINQVQKPTKGIERFS